MSKGGIQMVKNAATFRISFALYPWRFRRSKVSFQEKKKSSDRLNFGKGSRGREPPRRCWSPAVEYSPLLPPPSPPGPYRSGNLSDGCVAQFVVSVFLKADGRTRRDSRRGSRIAEGSRQPYDANRFSINWIREGIQIKESARWLVETFSI